MNSVFAACQSGSFGVKSNVEMRTRTGHIHSSQKQGPWRVPKPELSGAKRAKSSNGIMCREGQVDWLNYLKYSHIIPTAGHLSLNRKLVTGQGRVCNWQVRTASNFSATPAGKTMTQQSKIWKLRHSRNHSAPSSNNHPPTLQMPSAPQEPLTHDCIIGGCYVNLQKMKMASAVSWPWILAWTLKLLLTPSLEQSMYNICCKEFVFWKKRRQRKRQLSHPLNMQNDMRDFKRNQPQTERIQTATVVLWCDGRLQALEYSYSPLYDISQWRFKGVYTCFYNFLQFIIFPQHAFKLQIFSRVPADSLWKLRRHRAQIAKGIRGQHLTFFSWRAQRSNTSTLQRHPAGTKTESVTRASRPKRPSQQPHRTKSATGEH